jgi:hypothetical protein
MQRQGELVTFGEGLQALLGRKPDDKIQLVYITLENGKVLVFLGAPVTLEDADQIDTITFGEQVSPFLLSIAVSAIGTVDGFTTQ